MSGCYTVRDVLGSPARRELRGRLGCPHEAVRAVVPAGCVLFGDCVQ